VNGANAFLKTLEEPGQDTLLILIADPSHRLPATIASRCRRMNLRAPAPALARAWLAAQSPSVQDWDAALALSGGAPLLAAQWDAGKMAALDEDMRQSLEQWMRGTVDVTLLAERWVKSDPLLRLRWLENWITQRVNSAFGTGASRETAEPVCLPAALLKPKIRTQFELLDAVREFRRLASTSMNQQLALEALLLGGRAALMN
jgi:DNA polymerase-3 subunit delta'